MMRLGRRTALLVAFSLLASSANAAFAEDAWVLWDQSVYAVAGQDPAVLWNQWGSSTTKAGCEELRRNEVKTYEQASKLLPNWSMQDDTIVQMDNGKVLRRTTYHCYPATINPRWEHLASLGNWYLMGPRRTAYDKTAAYLRGFQVLTDRTLSQWELLDAFESRQVCELRRDSLRRIEESSYSKAAASYLQMMREQTETPAVSLQRYMVEIYHANIRTYAASRCVSRGDPGLPRGLRAK